jgi:hypothetical protein
MCRNCILTAVLLMLGYDAPVVADIIVDQPVTSGQYSSQYFPDFPMFSGQAFDDFALNQTFRLTTFRAFGIEAVNSHPAANISVTAEIRSAANLNSPVLLSAVGSEVGTDLVFDFGGATLGPGTYWISAYVTRPDGTGGQWYWSGHQPVTGNAAKYHNPGDGFGLGNDPVDLVSGQPSDLAFRLEGTPVPAPPAVVLIGIGLGTGYLVRRRSVRVPE